MQIFGLSITRAGGSAPAPPVPADASVKPRRKFVSSGYQSLESHRGWFPIIREGFTGAWQRNIVTSVEDVLTFAAVYACVTLKASDIAKLRIKLMAMNDEGIWSETTNPAYSPVLRKPNHYQVRQEMMEQWMVSKFIHGNTYILKQRNNRGGDRKGNVEALYVLDPRRVRVLVTPDGDVYYALSTDPLSTLSEAVVVPASEIIHDKMTPLYHPLCGISPITACGLAATQGIRAQQQSSRSFEQGSIPSGTITMPDEIDNDQATEIQKRWQDQFSGNNAGKVAVLGYGMKYEPMTMSANDTQLIAQLEWTAVNVCTAHHVPPYMVGVGQMPSYDNVEALNSQYYSQALQTNIEMAEALLDDGLETGDRIGTELDLDGLLRMDTGNRMEAAEKAMKAGMSPDEVRRKFHDLGKVAGGALPYLQQQNYSLAALAKRDAKADPFAKTSPTPKPAAPAAPAGDKTNTSAELSAAVLHIKTRGLVLRQEFAHV